MIDPTLLTGFTALIERACNHTLTYDPATQRKLARMAGQVLAVESTMPALTFYIAPQADGTLMLMNHFDGAVTTRIRGRLPDLMSLLFSHGQSTSLSQHNVDVIGSTSLLIDLQALFQTLDIDWEDALEARFGNLVSHPVAQGLRQAANFMRQRGATAQRLTAEYLTEELRVIPSRPELEDYSQQVDQLRLAKDRAEATLKHLQQRLARFLQPTPHSDQ